MGERPKHAHGLLDVRQSARSMLLAILIVISFRGKALGENMEEFGHSSSYRKNHHRALQDTCIRFNTIKDEMIDCIRDAIDGGRPPMPLESNLDEGRFGPGIMTPNATYSQETIDKFRYCHIALALQDVQNITVDEDPTEFWYYKSPSLELVCCPYGAQVRTPTPTIAPTNPTERPSLRPSNRPRRRRKSCKKGNRERCRKESKKERVQRSLQAWEEPPAHCVEEEIIQALCRPCNEQPHGYCAGLEPMRPPTPRPSLAERRRNPLAVVEHTIPL